MADSKKIWFVGAGPGHPDLITVRGRELISRAGAILYAGSLVSQAHLTFAPADCERADSAGMTLDEMIDWLADKADKRETVIRLQTGDPSLYGALAETAHPLMARGFEIGVVPGVSSAMASAAAAVQSLTLPETTQTVILTRVEGRTPMPDGENLADLARSGATLCLFLSATLTRKIVTDLTGAGWPETAPILVVHKASWPGEERVFQTPLNKLPELVATEKIKGQAMIIVSKALATADGPKSRLYAPDFSHRFRQARDE